jgi:hypothetical protein
LTIHGRLQFLGIKLFQGVLIVLTGCLILFSTNLFIAPTAPTDSTDSTDSTAEWTPTDWLPQFIENKAYSIAQTREGSRTGYPNAKTNIDTHIKFHSFKEIMAYIPRALQIGLFAPFPVHWFGEGRFQHNTWMRRIAAFEMIGLYFFLPFLLFSLWHWRKKIEIWMIMVFSFGMILLLSLIVCNIGTLYRMRYGYIMILMALSIAGFIKLCEKLNHVRNSRNNKLSKI